MVVTGSSALINLIGTNVRWGDQAKWVRQNATSCESRFDVTRTNEMQTMGDGVAALFSFINAPVGTHLLCYKFNYAQSSAGGATPTPFLLFRRVRAAVVRYDSVMPRGTGIGCVSNLTITGAGFDGMQLNSSADGGVSWALTPASALTCAFTGAPSSAATILNDTTITCTSPAPTAVGTLPLKLSMGAFTAGHPLSFPSFGVFDPTNYTIETLRPNGGAYNRESDLAITGTFTGADWGAVRCRVGGWVGTSGFLINDTHAVCRKPRFPDLERAAVGDYAVTFSPNGQCFSSASSNSSSVMFKTYNSQVNSLTVSGGPATSSVTLQVVGAGFVYPALVGGVCRFARQGAVPPLLLPPPLLPPLLPSSIVFTSLTTVNSTLARCPTPASGTAGTWKVQVLQNGLDPEPTLYGSDPEFTEYDLTAVRVMALMPPGASLVRARV